MLFTANWLHELSTDAVSRLLMLQTVKSIFQCNAKLIALGPGVGLDPQRHNFTLRIPTCWYLKMPNFA